MSIYESLIEIVDTKPKILFAGVPYALATEDAERVGVDHIARSSVTGATERSAGVYVCMWWACTYGDVGYVVYLSVAKFPNMHSLE